MKYNAFEGVNLVCEYGHEFCGKCQKLPHGEETCEEVRKIITRLIIFILT